MLPAHQLRDSLLRAQTKLGHSLLFWPLILHAFSSLYFMYFLPFYIKLGTAVLVLTLKNLSAFSLQRHTVCLFRTLLTALAPEPVLPITVTRFRAVHPRKVQRAKHISLIAGHPLRSQLDPPNASSCSPKQSVLACTKQCTCSFAFQTNSRTSKIAFSLLRSTKAQRATWHITTRFVQMADTIFRKFVVHSRQKTEYQFFDKMK